MITRCFSYPESQSLHWLSPLDQEVPIISFQWSLANSHHQSLVPRCLFSV